jgi:glycerophosphoryl diester phosphodiesterase
VTAFTRVWHKGVDAVLGEPAGQAGPAGQVAWLGSVEMLEFDVLSTNADGTGELRVAHDAGDLGLARDLGDVLSALGDPRFASHRFNVDLKRAGYELRTLAAVGEAGLTGRVLISSMDPGSLAVIRAADPAVAVGWSVPRVSRDYTAQSSTRLLALAALVWYRVALPGRVGRALAGGRCDAIMAHWRVVTPRLVAAVAAAGGELYVWTVDDAREIVRLRGLGVTGVISNEPALFAGAGAGFELDDGRTT